MLRPGRRVVEDPRVTVVVASRNRREELLSTLARHRAPVILVDNASTDGTAEAVTSAYPDVDVVAMPRNIAAAARTIGVRRARTPYVAFADDDSWWAPGSLAKAADALESHPTVALVNVRTLVGADERLDPFCDVLAGSPLPMPPGAAPGPRILGFMACAAVVRRDAFLQVGGFDRVIRFPGEEERLSWDLTAAGWCLSYLDDAVVHHHPSPRRDAADERRAAVVRSAVLTALMRLPWSRVRGCAVRALRGSAADRRGVRQAALRAPRALLHRRTLPRTVLDDLDLLDDQRRAGALVQRPAAADPAGTGS